MRRRAAGELSELFGSAALPLDRSSRMHGFRALAPLDRSDADAKPEARPEGRVLF